MNRDEMIRDSFEGYLESNRKALRNLAEDNAALLQEHEELCAHITRLEVAAEEVPQVLRDSFAELRDTLVGRMNR